uniref:DUF2263 domain-containing protein n=1 Tax=Macrostomum lignano TaxID=282301 RepID=A0A1I8JPU2_9PLAT
PFASCRNRCAASPHPSRAAAQKPTSSILLSLRLRYEQARCRCQTRRQPTGKLSPNAQHSAAAAAASHSTQRDQIVAGAILGWKQRGVRVLAGAKPSDIAVVPLRPLATSTSSQLNSQLSSLTATDDATQTEQPQSDPLADSLTENARLRRDLHALAQGASQPPRRTPRRRPSSWPLMKNSSSSNSDASKDVSHPKLYRLVDNNKFACKYHSKGRQRVEQHSSQGRLADVLFLDLHPRELHADLIDDCASDVLAEAAALALASLPQQSHTNRTSARRPWLLCCSTRCRPFEWYLQANLLLSTRRGQLLGLLLGVLLGGAKRLGQRVQIPTQTSILGQRVGERIGLRLLCLSGIVSGVRLLSWLLSWLLVPGPQRHNGNIRGFSAGKHANSRFQPRIAPATI